MIKVEELIERRNKIYQSLDDNSVLILFGGVSLKRSNDSYFPLEINKNFYYLTGIDEENATLMVVKQDGVIIENLFVLGNNELLEKFTGKLLSFEEASKISGIENVYAASNFESELDLYILGKKNLTRRLEKVYLDLSKENFIDGYKTTQEYRNLLELNYSHIKVEDIIRELVRLRLAKSKTEVSEIEEAIIKTNGGLKAILKELHPNLKEFNVASIFDNFVRGYGANAFYRETYVAGGPNTLYMKNINQNRELRTSDLIVIDSAVKENKYVAPICRTYPVSGKFNDLQKSIYQAILDALEFALREIKPGAFFTVINDEIYKNLANSILNLKLFQNEVEIKRAIPRIVLYHTGLDERDPSIIGKALESGNILTLDLGVFVKEKNFAIRLKDIILVTDTGCYLLSKDVLREINEIEIALNNR